jgi:hypothetical protein
LGEPVQRSARGQQEGGNIDKAGDELRVMLAHGGDHSPSHGVPDERYSAAEGGSLLGDYRGVAIEARLLGRGGVRSVARKIRGSDSVAGIT